MKHTSVSVGSRICLAGEGLGMFQGRALTAGVDTLRTTVTIDDHAHPSILASYGPPFEAVEPSLDILGAVTRVLRKRGAGIQAVKVKIASTIPPGVGLASSGALFSALTIAFNDHFGLGLDQHALVDIAFKAEHEDQGVFVGRTDAYAVIFGGGLFQDHATNPPRIRRLRLPPDTVILIGTAGIGTSYGRVGASIRARIASRDIGLIRYRAKSNALVDELVHVLMTSADRSEIGRLLDKINHAIRSDLRVPNNQIDEFVLRARNSGAFAAKTCAVRFEGGSMFALCTPETYLGVCRELLKAGALVHVCKVDYRESTGVPAQQTEVRSSPPLPAL